MIKQFPCLCPSCSSDLVVMNLQCTKCETVVSGRYELPVFARLDKNDQQFILDFVKSSGSLKEMAKTLGFSYPTVRNMLDDLIRKLKDAESDEEEQKTA